MDVARIFFYGGGAQNRDTVKMQCIMSLRLQQGEGYRMQEQNMPLLSKAGWKNYNLKLIHRNG